MDFSATATLDIADATCTVACAGMGGFALQALSTFSGTITFEATVDGVNWVSTKMAAIGATASATTTTSAGLFVGQCVGMQAVRGRMSSYSSGAAIVTIRAVPASPSIAFLT
jgi:hypothetical protein